MCHVPSETESHLAPGGSWLCFLEQPYDIGGCILPDRRYLLDCHPPSRLVCIPVDYISSRERWRLDLCVNTITACLGRRRYRVVAFKLIFGYVWETCLA